jgi:hypothetical protein
MRKHAAALIPSPPERRQDMTDKMPQLTPSQQDDIERAHELLAAIDGGRDSLIAHQVAVYREIRRLMSQEPDPRREQMITEDPYPEATGTAAATIRALLAIISGLTGGAL